MPTLQCGMPAREWHHRPQRHKQSETLLRAGNCGHIRLVRLATACQHRSIVNSHAEGPPEHGPTEANRLPKDVFLPTDRERLVRAMGETCVERGYAEATVDEVLERTGLPAEVFMQNFEGKEDCAVAAINLVLAEATAASSAAWSSDSSEIESIVLGFKALLDLFAARPSFAPLLYVQARYAMPNSCFEPYDSGVTIMASMIDRLRIYATQETLAPKTTARAVLGSAGMVIRRAILAGETRLLPELLPDIVYGVLVPYLGQREALQIAGQARGLLNEGG